MYVENHIACDSDGGEQLDPLGSSTQFVANVSSSKNE